MWSASALGTEHCRNGECVLEHICTDSRTDTVQTDAEYVKSIHAVTHTVLPGGCSEENAEQLLRNRTETGEHIHLHSRVPSLVELTRREILMGLSCRLDISRTLPVGNICALQYFGEECARQKVVINNLQLLCGDKYDAMIRVYPYCRYRRQCDVQLLNDMCELARLVHTLMRDIEPRLLWVLLSFNSNEAEAIGQRPSEDQKHIPAPEGRNALAVASEEMHTGASSPLAGPANVAALYGCCRISIQQLFLWTIFGEAFNMYLATRTRIQKLIRSIYDNIGSPLGLCEGWSFTTAARAFDCFDSAYDRIYTIENRILDLLPAHSVGLAGVADLPTGQIQAIMFRSFVFTLPSPYMSYKRLGDPGVMVRSHIINVTHAAPYFAAFVHDINDFMRWRLLAMRQHWCEHLEQTCT